MTIDFLGKGWKFPIRVNGRGGLSYVSGAQSIAEAIWIILATPPNSRVMEPAFGCGIHSYVFAPNNANTVATVSQEVRKALLRWEPRIDVLDVRVDTHLETPNVLLIYVDYRIRANNAFHNLVYPFYINEGGGQ
ncbi:MAG: GPW/gp25 family protein [Anaerolineales bacterium]|nr:GPW/gp25 family protein [Anaerolineales bacterium]